MTLVQKTINGHDFYTDGNVYYTFQQVKADSDTLWNFACTALGITKKTGFNSQETKDITDLAGIGSLRPTRFLLLKDDNAVRISYLPNGRPNLHPEDIILRSVASPDGSDPVIPPGTTAVPGSDTTRSVQDRLKEIEALHHMNLLTDTEYQEKRAKIIAEL